MPPSAGAQAPAPAPVLATVGATALAEPVVATIEGPAVDPFADTDRDWTQGEVIEVGEPAGSTWFDELEESVSPVLPPSARS